MNIAALLALLATSTLPGFNRPAATDRSGNLCLAGQLIIELSPAVRGRIVLDQPGRFGVPELDALCRRWQVERIEPLMRHPNPSPAALKYGCDLQFLVELPVEADIEPALDAFQTSPLVADVSPNLLMPVIDDIPNDSLYPLQWHLPKIGAPFAWGISHGDTSVLIAVMDDGCEWHHPDIQPNVWINQAEDINGNGRFDTLPWPDGDIDGIDQDTNGYTDDVIGFDMILGMPDPKPYLVTDAHGTHCWGIANAVANNTSGVAGAAWNCRSFAYRCGGGGLISLYAAIAGMYHAVPKGAWVISLSFGSYSYNQSMADACAYAWESGTLVVGGAGNDGTNRIFYPANYEHVISVAASDRQDAKPSWSNYGDWIEVVSPGVGIWSTVPPHRYEAFDGTSMATPLTAGALAWLKSKFPSFTNVQAESALYASCEPMRDTLYGQGLLGHGRISMSRAVLPLYRSDLHLSDWRFRDENGNGRPDPGENASLVVSYVNTTGWRDATGVTATLSSASPYVDILKSTAAFPDIPAGSSGNCSADSFVLRVRDNAPPQMLSLNVTVSATPEPASPETSFSVQSGDKRVLIVDDDLGLNYERYYTAACDSNGVLYDTYSVLANGSPSAETLLHYPVVIWFTGDDSATTLTTADITGLTAFLDAGHNLLLSGQNIAQDLAGSDFLADYLHAELLDDSTGKPYLVGIAGDPVTQGDTMVAAGAGGANNAKSLDGVRPLGGAQACAFYRDYPDDTTAAIIRYSGAYRLVFFPVPFEAIDHSVSRYLQKWTLIKRILEYFGERVPGVEQPAQPSMPRPRHELQVFPNPARPGLVTLHFVPRSLDPLIPRSLRLYNAAGRAIGHWLLPVGCSSFPLDLRSMSPGVYMVNAGGSAMTKLVIAQ